MRRNSLVLRCISTLALGTAAAGEAAVLVLTTSDAELGKTYPAGTLIERGDLVLAAGQSVSAIVDGQMKVLKGPFRLAAKPATANESPLLAQLAQAARAVEARQIAVGATRGFSLRRGSAAGKRDLWALDVTGGGVVCMSDPNRLTLWRYDPVVPLRASIEDRDSGKRVFFDWPKGVQTIPWPKAVRPTRPGRYLFYGGPGQSRDIEVRSIAGGGRGVSLLTALAQQKCLTQFELLANDAALIP